MSTRQQRRFWSLSLVLLAALACDGDQPAGPMDEEDEDEESITGASLPLVEGREVSYWDERSGTPSATRKFLSLTGDTNSVVGQLLNACAKTEWLSLTGSMDTAGPTGTCNPTTVLDNTGAITTRHAMNDVLALTCAGQWALQIATSAKPTYISQLTATGTPVVVHTRKDKLGEPWDSVPAFKTATIQRLSTIDPPKPSEAASWALLATELLREATFDGAMHLQCLAYSTPVTFTALNGETVDSRNHIATTLSDAAMTMMEAAQEAERLIAAAADSKLASSAASDEEAIALAWRDRHDSRLEVASLFGSMSERVYARVQPRGLWERRCSGSSCFAGTATRYAYTTRDTLSDFATVYSGVRRIGYLLPYTARPKRADSTASDAPKLISTYLVSAGANYGLVTAAGKSGWQSLLGTGATFSLFQHEGWSIDPTEVAAKDRVLVRVIRNVTSSTSSAAAFRFVPDGEAYDAAQYTGISFWVLKEPPAQAGADVGRFPVATTVASRPQEVHAERVLRSARVNPCFSDLTGVVKDWCSEALAGLPAGTKRTVNDIARDLVLVARKGVSSTTVTEADITARLSALGFDKPALLTAAQAIVERAAVLGRAIVPDPDWPIGSTLRANLVLGLSESTRPVDAAYLFARTLGQPDLSRDWQQEYNTPGNWARANARQSIFGALEFLVERFGLSGTWPQSTLSRVLQQLVSWSQQQIAYSANVVFTPDPASPSRVDGFEITLGTDLTIPGLKRPDVHGKCSVWLNEAGLECALTGRVGEKTCDSDAYRFSDTGGVFGAVIGQGQAPERTSVGRAILDGDRIYVTCDVGNGPEVFTAFTAQVPRLADIATGAGQFNYRYAILPPYSKAMAEHLQRTLAADVVKPEKGAVSCVGVPYDVELALDDEVSEALSGAKNVESSFAHYLSLARQAATKADELGDQLLAQGLEMDMRAEAARDELESLCGGQINVPRLQSAACRQDDCDVVKFLNRDTATLSVDEQRDLAGLRDCFGLQSSTAPVNAVLGNEALCMWQYKDDQGTLPPCTCPSRSQVEGKPWAAHYNTLCKSGGRIACPEIPEKGQLCKSFYRLTYGTNDDNDRDPQTGKARELPADFAGGFYAVKAPDTMNVSVTSARSQPSHGVAADGSSVFACGGLLALRYKHIESRRKLVFWEPDIRDGLVSKYRDPAEWITQSKLRSIAQMIGFDRDLYGMPTITFGGKPWIDFSSSGGPRSDASVGWPCARHPLLDLDVEGHDSTGALGCALPEVGSLYCGGLCTGSTATSRAKNMAGNLANRMKRAVLALKAVAGARIENVEEYTSWPNTGLQITPGMSYGGILPVWFPWATEGQPFVKRSDGQGMCWLNQPDWATGTCSRSYPVIDEDMAQMPDPWFLWYPRSCTQVEQVTSAGATVAVEGCGDMLDLLGGSAKPVDVVVRESARSCPSISKSVCAVTKAGAELVMDACGEALRATDLWQSEDVHVPVAARSQLHKLIRLTEQRLIDSGRLERDLLDEGDYGGRYDGGRDCHTCPWDAYRDEQGRSLLPELDRTFLSEWPNVDQTRYLEARNALLVTELRAVDDACKGKVVEQTVGERFGASEVLDGLELACSRLMDEQLGCDTLMDANFVPRDVDEFPVVAERVQCAADRVEGSIERMWMHAIPKDVAGAVRAQTITNIFPKHRGEYGEVVAALAAELQESVRSAQGVLQALRDLKLDMQESSLQLNKLDLEQSIADVDVYIEGLQGEARDLEAKIGQVRTRQAISSNVTKCAAAVASASGNWAKTGFGMAAGDMIAAAATCADSAVQIRAEQEIAKLQAGIDAIQDDISRAVVEKIEIGQQVTEKEKQIVLVGVARQMNVAMDRVNESLHALKQSYARVQGHLVALDGIRSRAQRAAAKVLLLGDDELGRVYSVNSAMRARMNTLRKRYNDARSKALKLSFLARRSIEQKFGVEMSQMRNDMTLVAAPRGWVDKLCTTTGLNYDKKEYTDAYDFIRRQSGREKFDYADMYIGDWLDKLEGFVESYRLDYPFQDGSDLAVVSVRDEVVNSYEECSREGWNQLYYTDGRFAEASINTDYVGWEYVCDDGGTSASAAIAEAVEESPFACSDSTLSQCRLLGNATAVLLQPATYSSCGGGVSTGVGSTEPAPTAPPAGSAYWFRADNCTETSPGSTFISRCANLSAESGAENRPMTANNTSVKLLPTGIGGKHTLEINTNGAFLTTPIHPTAGDKFTMSFVARSAGTSAQSAVWSYAETLPDGQYRSGSLLLMNNTNAWAQYQASYDGRGGNTRPATSLNANMPRSSAAAPRQGVIVTVVADGSSGHRLYVNGALVVESNLPVPSLRLGGTLLGTYTAGSVAQLAESLSYPRALSADDLDSLHRYLASRYDIDIDGPASSYDGTDMREAQANNGTSQSSGYTGATTDIFDSVRRVFNTTQATTASSTTPMAPVPFSGGTQQHYGIPFDGNDLIWYGSFGSRCDKLEGSSACTPYYGSHRDFAVTTVARLDDNTSMHGIWHAGLQGAGLHLGLRVDARSGAVIVEWVDANSVKTAYTTEPNLVTPGVPFVLTLSGSRASGAMQVHVNGALHLTVPRYPELRGDYRIGQAISSNTAHLWGAIAEQMFHVQPKTPADISALHATLGAEYGIPVSSAGGSSGSAVGQVGPEAVGGPARMRQIVDVGAGTYFLSWYQKALEAPLTAYVDFLDESRDPQVFTPTETPSDTILSDADARAFSTPTSHATEVMLREGWVRYFVPVKVSRGGAIAVGFVATPEPTHLAAPQLEYVDDSWSALPVAFFPTDSSLARTVDKCEDSDGSTFRGLWKRGCEYYCDQGSGTECAVDGDPSNLSQRCYYELDFAIPLEEIEAGTLLPQAGFSRGNFNYRVDDLAVNLVGTAVKNCELSTTPSTCYGGNFLQYSLYQDQPYRIRNFDGDIVYASLPPGKVHQAKALLAERYLTNPLSGADRNLLSDYWRTELKGRPLDGYFKLRIYDSDGFNFNALEDVQLALRYRYWTRFTD